MTSLDSNTPSQPTNGIWRILGAAIAAAFVFAFINAMTNKPGNPGQFLHSTDDMVRMVIVRDWLNGQSWFDPLLHRLGFEPGTYMHWSRLIDAPIGLLVLIGNFFREGSGEYFATRAWPFLVFAAALAGMLTAVRRTTGSDNVIPTLIIGGYALWSWGAFYPGVIDHHNVQAALAMWLIANLLPAQNSVRNFTYAGVIMAMMLAIGLESLPIAVAGAVVIFIRLLVEKEQIYEATSRFGLSLAISIATLFFLLIGPQNYAATHCDSLSVFHLVCAGVGGILLFLTLHRTIRQRLPAVFFVGPGIAAVVVFGLAIAFFPQCLDDPVAGIDPVLRHFWLDYIIEAQNVFQIANIDPWLLVYLHALSVMAITAIVWQLTRRGQTTNKRLTFAMLLVFLIVTSAVTLFQMRGIQQSGPTAGLTLAILVTLFMERTGKEKPILALAVLVLCCNLFWKLFVIAGVTLSGVEPGPLMNQSEAETKNICRNAEDLALLRAEKPGFIAAANGLGPWLMLSTEHRVLSGPYHRNGEGNLASIRLMIGKEQEVRQIIKDNGITLYAVCPKFVDEKVILREIPDSFMAQLVKGAKVDWLEPIQTTMEKPLMLWRVRNP